MMVGMVKIKAPAARGFTLAEKRALLFEQVSLYAVFLVAVIAAVISFVALAAVGREAGLGHASYLLPIAIDGFGIACSVGIVRSVASGEPGRERISEWIGLLAALCLSILGNVTHSLAVGAATLPDYVKIAYATAIPMIVAYGIHVYGRAMSRGISAHVLADNPDELQFDLVHLGEQETVARAHAPAKVTRAPQPAARALSSAPAQPPAPPARAAQPTAIASANEEQARMRGAFDAAITADPLTRPNFAAMHRELGLTANIATSRRWATAWWDAHEAALGTARPEPTTDVAVDADEKATA